LLVNDGEIREGCEVPAHAHEDGRGAEVGAAPAAALFAPQSLPKEVKRIGAVVSGGNVDLSFLQSLGGVKGPSPGFGG